MSFIDKDENYILMHGNSPLIMFNPGEHTTKVFEQNEHLLPISLKGEIKEGDLADSHKEQCKIALNNNESIIDFLARRVVDISRRNAKWLYSTYCFPQNDSPYNRAEISLACRSLSMSDCYWVKKESESITWEDVNPRINPINMEIAECALLGTGPIKRPELYTTEFASWGESAKAWLRDNNRTYLYKKLFADELEIELSVSKILDCFDIPHVRYVRTSYKGEEMCHCENMATERFSIIPADEVLVYCINNDIDFAEYVLGIDSQSIYEMCIVDYLVSNPNRTSVDWGFYVDNETGEIEICHPLISHSKAFDKKTMADDEGGMSQVLLGKTMKEAALIAMKNCKIRNLKKVTKDLFVTREMYDSFMKRAVQLGLYKECKLTFIDKVLGRDKYQTV